MHHFAIVYHLFYYCIVIVFYIFASTVRVDDSDGAGTRRYFQG